MKKDKATSLYMFFLRYLALFCLINMIITVVMLFSFYGALMKGIILPANYAEQVLERVESRLSESTFFDKSLIPFTCKYVLFDDTGDVQSSNMSPREISRWRNFLKGKIQKGKNQYKVIQRNDGGNLIIQYDIMAHFSSPTLHGIFSKPELLGIIMLFLLFVLVAIVLAVRFSKKLKIELAPLINATESIKQKDLDFEIVPTKIQELNRVLESINQLKGELSYSLKQQWDIEKSKKTQVSAITHDIKTPLTIIKGNTELLLESDLPKSDQELLHYIQASSKKIENYMELLVSATTMTEVDTFREKKFFVEDLITELEQQTRGLCRVKNITLSIKKNILWETFCGDQLLINTAVLNVLDNAVQYSPCRGNLEFTIYRDQEQLMFTVADQGKGFSALGLKKATEEFFTEQTQRSGKHYGMGLYIGKIVAQKYQGTLNISNRQDGCGALVSLTFKNRKG